MPIFDVAIIGAGPAGGSAAWNSAKSGLKTVVLEEHQTIGEPVHCGECLSKMATERMQFELPEKVISEHVKGVRVVFPDSSSSTLTEPGFVLEKHLFEQWLAESAQQEGAELLLDHKALDLKRENEIWKIKTSHGEIQSRILMDATGSQGIASQKLQLNPRGESVIGVQYLLKDIPRDGYLDFFLWPELAPHGYLWMIPKSGGRANVGLVTTEKNRAKFFCDEFVKKMGWQEKEIVRTFGGLIPASGPLPNTYSDGLFLIGDSAGFTSPLFEGGTQLALRSGQFASQVAGRAIRENNLSKKSLAEYEQLWKKEFPRYERLIKGKNALYSFSNTELNQMAAVMPRELANMKPTDKAKVGLKVLVRHQNLLKKGVLDAFRAFAYSRAKYYGW